MPEGNLATVLLKQGTLEAFEASLCKRPGVWRALHPGGLLMPAARR
jgi:hypothetical protein